ncbi:MAG: DsbA family protein [Ardenticatenaceae bacterium]|nr:DsbA family protein [Anaerolineales bacterium]MCB8923412.1 DsbA family protein [Ardenticatenaceae bacterium]MCB9003863.1 DsbA family protein [Ardenticatenaceae bacterium]
MSKNKPQPRRQSSKRQTNWLLIGGVIAIGVIALFALLFLSLQEPEVLTLAEFCAANPDNCITDGNKDAAVTIVEVADFGCSHCRDFHEETYPALISEYVDTDQVYWITLPYALSSTTLPASNAAMCANEQGAFHEYGSALFAQQSEPVALTRDGFVQAAEQLGLNMDAFNSCLAEGRYNGIVQDNISAARTAHVSATPSFFINDRLVEGAVPISVFQQRISAAMN